MSLLNKKKFPFKHMEALEKEAFSYIQGKDYVSSSTDLANFEVKIPYPRTISSEECIVLIPELSNAQGVAHIFLHANPMFDKSTYLGAAPLADILKFKEAPTLKLISQEYLHLQGIPVVKMKKPLYFLSIQSNDKLWLALIKDDVPMQEVSQALMNLEITPPKEVRKQLGNRTIKAKIKSVLIEVDKLKTHYTYLSWQGVDTDILSNFPNIGWSAASVCHLKAEEKWRYKSFNKFNLTSPPGSALLKELRHLMTINSYKKELIASLVDPIAMSL